MDDLFDWKSEMDEDVPAFDDAAEPLDLVGLVPALGPSQEAVASRPAERFDSTHPHFRRRKQMLTDPVLSTGGTFPTALHDIDLKSKTAERVLKMYWPVDTGGMPDNIVIRSLQFVQNETIRIGLGNFSSKMTYGFHGTPIENVESIVKEGFKRGMGSMGYGVYVARTFRKAHTYALHGLGPDGELVDNGDERAMFLCTMKLGIMADLAAGTVYTDLHDKVDSLTRTSNGEQEYMLYDPERVRPLYLLRYVQLRAVMMTDEQKRRATLTERFYTDAKALGLWSRKGPVITSAVHLLMSIPDRVTQDEMYTVFRNFILLPKLRIVMTKVDHLIAAGRLQAIHKTAIEGDKSWQEYMCYTNIMNTVKQHRKGPDAFIGRYKFYELLTALAVVAAENNGLTTAQQLGLRNLFSDILTCSVFPEDAVKRYNARAYCKQGLLKDLEPLMRIYWLTKDEDYKSALVKNKRPA